MYTLILIVHIFASICLILIVLLQTGKGGGLSGLFGGGGSETVFSGSGGNIFLKKVTAILAVIFMCTSLLLTLVSLRQPRRTIMEKIPAAPETPALPPGHPQPPQEPSAPK